MTGHTSAKTLGRGKDTVSGGSVSKQVIGIRNHLCKDLFRPMHLSKWLIAGQATQVQERMYSAGEFSSDMGDQVQFCFSGMKCLKNG